MTGMITDPEITGVLGIALELTMICVVAALAAAVIRLLRGPTLADRVVALDMISVLLVVFIVVFRMLSGVEAYIYVAIGLALISFLATVSFAGYMDRAEGDSGAVGEESTKARSAEDAR
jgi:multicomponent Na+:H+ antiporter subunit F